MKQKTLKQSDYEKIGMAIYKLSDVHTPKKLLYRTAFIKGVFSGFGGVLGATVLVGILLFVLSLFDNIPLIGRFTQSVRETVQTSR